MAKQAKKPAPSPELVERVALALRRDPHVSDYTLRTILNATADEIRVARRAAMKLVK